MEVQHIRGSEAVPQEMAKNDGWIMKMVNGLGAERGVGVGGIEEREMFVCLKSCWCV